MGLDIVYIFFFIKIFTISCLPKIIFNTNFKNISRFIKKDLVHRYEAFDRLILDKKLKNKDLIDNLTIKYDIKKIITSAYHS